MEEVSPLEEINHSLETSSESDGKGLRICNRIFFVFVVLGLFIQLWIHFEVIPKFVDLFRDMSIELPILTNFVISTNDWMKWVVVLVAIFMLFKEVLFKNKKYCLIFNVGYLIFTGVHILIVVFALFEPLVEMKDSLQ